MQIRVSTGSAAVLGKKQIRLQEKPTTIYLLAHGECRGDCGFCPQARSFQGDKKWLSRVSWPLYELEELFPPGGLGKPLAEIKRICIQTILEPDWSQKLISAVRYLKSLPYLKDIPISASCRPVNIRQAESLLAAGIDRLGIPLDVATGELFQRIKGGSFSAVYSTLVETAKAFPGRISTHLIIGLGESEEEAARLIQTLAQEGITTALFALTPVLGTRLAKYSPPSRASYRRLQALRYLLAQGREVDLMFDSAGRITSFGYPKTELFELLSDGAAFQTSGCPGCNRPYYNERPGEVPYNYPRPLSAGEISQALAELGK
ncbi:MAG: radical SAM protein [Firmicutes bacterium]|nr:radical SAM protein [Bacillota bacterium]